jgi:anthranilate synthase
MVDDHTYRTVSDIEVLRSVTETSLETAIEEVLLQLDSQTGGLLSSSYEYPGRYKRWAMGFVNPPLEISSRGDEFRIAALNDRGKVLLPHLSEQLRQCSQLQEITSTDRTFTGQVQPSDATFTEEERSKQPSVFSVIRTILETFSSDEDSHLGLYGAFGYDLVFQFEAIEQRLIRPDDQRDLVLYLPDELLVVDYYLQQAFWHRYEFATAHGRTHNLPRSGEAIDYRGKRQALAVSSDHAVGDYANQVRDAIDYFRRGDLFEVVPGQSFFTVCDARPTQLFQTLQQINPSPYGFIFNLGGEFLVGASPEMFVRVEGRRVETCPISGTIQRGQDAIEDAEQIRQLLNSHKDEVELTMCTDVDRNDKSRICEPGSVKVIGRRQIEIYSHLIHTVDHVEGILRPQFDALDAFLSHTWAVTVTGAPKRAAMQFIEQHEQSARRWYGGAVGRLTFDGNMNTGLTLRTIRLKDSIAEVRVGATILFDSDPVAEEQETLTKAAALFETLNRVNQIKVSARSRRTVSQPTSASGQSVLLIDYEDSFVHTLANYIRQTGAAVTTLRHGFPTSVLDEIQPNLVVLSPGPGRPADFKVPQTVMDCVSRQIPIFGVCLGLQGIVESFGGQLGTLQLPRHGKSSQVQVTDRQAALFKDLPTSFEVGRYHSLFAMPESLPPDLKVTAVSEDGVIMAIEHEIYPIAAVQFHPESIMTLAGEVGLTIIKNVLSTYANSRNGVVQEADSFILGFVK